MGLRQTIRRLTLSPGYALTAIGTIALTITLATTVFAVVDGVLFKSLPYPDAHRLFRLTGLDDTAGSAALALADVDYLRDADTRIAVAMYQQGGSVVRSQQPALPFRTTHIGQGFFEVIGQPPAIGGFRSEHFEPRPATAPTPALLTHVLWRQWLAGDPSPVGRVVDVVGGRIEVVGVLPRDFVFPAWLGRGMRDLLLPLEFASVPTDRSARVATAVARLEPAISIAEAQQRLDAAFALWVDEYPPLEEAPRPGPCVAVAMRPLTDTLGARERPMFRVAFSGAALLVLLGAINVAGLFAQGCATDGGIWPPAQPSEPIGAT